MRRHEAANREQILRDRENNRRARERFEAYINPGGPMTQPGYDYVDTEEGIRLQEHRGMMRLQGGPRMDDSNFLDEMLTPEAFQRWKDMRTENEVIFTNLWHFQMTDHKLIGAHYDRVAEYIVAKERFVTGIADSLGRFTQLQSVEFLEPPTEGAKRYESLFRLSTPQAHGGRRKHDREDNYAYRGLMIGFDLLVRALQRANIYTQTFAIPTPSLNFHCFATSASQAVLCHVLSKT
jgi:hypothetical protein